MESRTGRVEVIAGPMFAGKTEELIRRIRRAALGHRSVQVFTHAVDARNRAGSVSTHAGVTFPSTSVASARALEQSIASDISVVGIDEAQFFGLELVEVADRLARQGIDVIIAGLAVTFGGEPFEPMPTLMALSERVDRLTAVCTVCGSDAIFHQRTVRSDTAATDLAGEHIGGLEKYQARCRIHFTPPEKALP